MSTRATELQPLAWEMDRDLPEAIRFVKGLRLPAPIRAKIGSLRDIPEMPKYPPSASLQNALAALAPEIIAFTPGYLVNNVPADLPDVWLYALPSETLDTGRLIIAIKAWLIACYGSAQAQAIESAWLAEGLHWEAWQTFDLNAASEPLKHLVLPGVIARWLVASHYQLKLPTKDGERELALHLVPLMTLRNIAELMTDPEEAPDGGYYSFVVRLWLQKLPYHHTLSLLPQLSVRRWRTRPLWTGKNKSYLDMKLNRGKSVYWRRNTGYVSQTQQEIVFTRLTLRCTNFGTDGVQWSGLQAKVLNELNTMSSLPSGFELTFEPEDYLPELLITSHMGDNERHRVGVGAWGNDHRMMFEGLDARISQIGTRHALVKQIEAVDKWRTPVRSEARRSAALLALPEPLCIELHVDDARLAKEKILKEVGSLHTYAHRLSENPLEVWHEGRLALRIVEMHMPLITELLPGDLSKKEAKRFAEEERQRTLRRLLPPTKMPTGALIALRNYGKTHKQNDPKSAARVALLQTGRLSKFFQPLDLGITGDDKPEPYDIRLTNSVRVLLGGLGYRAKTLYAPPKSVKMPPALDVLGFWFIQLNRIGDRKQKVTLPLVVEARFGEAHVRVSLPGTSPVAQTYYSVQEAINAAQSFQGDYTDLDRCIHFFRSVLDNCPSDRDGLLLLSDQNLRRVLVELQIQTSADVSLNGLLDEFPKLRVARLRLSADSEVPMCIPPVKRSKWTGLYAGQHARIFYSLYSKRTSDVGSEFRKLDKLSKPTSNPSTVQIWLQRLDKEDIPAEWGAYVHRLRIASTHTDIPTRLVQPLHDVVNLMLKYLPNAVKPNAEDEDENDE